MLFLALGPALPAAASAEPAAQAKAADLDPEKLRIGVLLTSLGDFDPGRKSFSAAFWIWTVGTKERENPLNRLEFPNAIKVESPNESQQATPQGIWSQRKIVGSFRHDWDLKYFPFDRQLLKIEMEEAELDTNSLIYLPDTANSSFDPVVSPKGWRIISYKVITNRKHYRTNFGDPRLPSGSPSAYARAEVMLLLERTDRSGFWKLTLGAFSGALMAMASFGLLADQASALGPRFGLLAGSAFAPVISLRSAASELGATGYTTLIDFVHAAVMFYILMATFAGVVAWRGFLSHGDIAIIHRLERRVAGFSTLLFGAMIIALVLGAMLVQPL